MTALQADVRFVVQINSRKHKKLCVLCVVAQWQMVRRH